MFQKCLKMKISFLFFLSWSFFFFLVTAKEQRIIGGEPAYISQFPYLAAIYKTTSDGQYFCGGSLYTQRWILTAGQCVDNAKSFTIYLGTANIKNLDSTAIKLATEEYVLHPDYNPLTLENDIGLIKLRMDITGTSYIQGVNIAASDISSTTLYGSIWAVGWGQTNDKDSELTDSLRKVQVKVLDNDECKITYGNQITDEMVCVAGNYNEGTCHGDTGTPLVLQYKIQLQFGIASFVSENGCESTDPSGFIRTYPYLNWIINVTST